ncbi:hypothetical protein [Rossellomorea sp. LJF3]|uniref:hypothetical protein n=1 Tax=Rossellomorea sp. LJF3 TaxID=3126099 RepID=UPI00300CF7A7
MNDTDYKVVWNLDSIFNEGSASPELEDHMKQTKARVSELEELMQKVELDPDQLGNVLDRLREIKVSISQMRSFAICLLSVDPDDQGAQFYRGETTAIQSSYDSITID